MFKADVDVDAERIWVTTICKTFLLKWVRVWDGYILERAVGEARQVAWRRTLLYNFDQTCSSNIGKPEVNLSPPLCVVPSSRFPFLKYWRRRTHVIWGSLDVQGWKLLGTLPPPSYHRREHFELF